MEYSQYVARRRARFKGCEKQQVNIPYGTVLEAQDGILRWQGKRLCVDTSDDAHNYFSQNDDGRGLERGALVGAICSLLEKRDKNYQARWNKIWPDSLCQKYRRPEHDDFWLWNHDFFNAPIEDLRHIAALISAKG